MAILNRTTPDQHELAWIPGMGQAIPVLARLYLYGLDFANVQAVARLIFERNTMQHHNLF